MTKQPKFNKVRMALPSMPEVVLICDFDRYSTGSMAMTMNESSVMEGDQKLGSVAQSAISSGVVVRVGTRTWTISAEELWKLGAAADEEYLKDADVRAQAAQLKQDQEGQNIQQS